MKFLIDAQLPRHSVDWFKAADCDALHTFDLPNGNRTSDGDIIRFADDNDRIVVTKDADFVDAHALHQRPAKLLLISTGNSSNHDLKSLLLPMLPSIIHEFRTHSFLELGPSGLIIRD